MLLVLFAKVLRFLPQAQNNGDEWNFVCGAHHIEKLPLKCLCRKDVLVTMNNQQTSLSTVFMWNYSLVFETMKTVDSKSGLSRITGELSLGRHVVQFQDLQCFEQHKQI